MEKKKLIEFKNIVKSFDGQIVLKGVNLDIYENEFVTLLGKTVETICTVTENGFGGLEFGTGFQLPAEVFRIDTQQGTAAAESIHLDISRVTAAVNE